MSSSRLCSSQAARASRRGGADDALVLIIDALDELPRDALQPVSLLATELKTLLPWIKLVVTSRDEAQINVIVRLHAVGAARRRGAEPAGREGVPD